MTRRHVVLGIRVVSISAIAVFARKHGMRAGDRLVDSELLQIPQFLGPDGKFDQDAFRAAIGQRGLTESAIREDLAMGLLAGFLARYGHGGEQWRLFIGVGLLGGFTTFSSFSMQTIDPFHGMAPFHLTDVHQHVRAHGITHHVDMGLRADRIVQHRMALRIEVHTREFQ